jgi:hypothetical protein
MGGTVHYKLTIDGGQRLLTGALFRVADHISADPKGWRYVRPTANLNHVCAIDVQRGVVSYIEHGEPVTPHPNWVLELRRLIAVNHPNMKES